MTEEVSTGLDLGSWESHILVADVYVDPAPVLALQALLGTRRRLPASRVMTARIIRSVHEALSLVDA